MIEHLEYWVFVGAVVLYIVVISVLDLFEPKNKGNKND